ncbi:SLC13 family permease [Paeniglutamicibacter gangotriensis]|uniref:TrkA-C domain-containing protein n=1 Tax=Paeniglutamicibacter gangotriensis Lz1y TaxID=1276920 RepID=M7MWQ3_9MICC|nr:SLC13 family permease [Paeniglutamicibacter gangotriensis]EMQ99375.1 TrkA-C domain-containing protein [Paeniglutamicibacter gangotriensis Lz1y]
MGFDAVLTLAIVLAVLVLLSATRIAADIILMGAALALMLMGILTPVEALSGFSNTGVITVAVLYVVAAGLSETGAVQWIAQNLLGRPSSIRGAYLRMLLPVGGLSAFLNNTTVVAMLLPAIQDWSARVRIPVSKMLIPLSYMAILGGTMTLIGTSTNLVIDGLLQAEKGVSLRMFDIAAVGVPLTVVGSIFLTLCGNRLLPNREDAVEQMQTAREYAVEFRVLANGPLVGKSVAAAGLRSLVHGFLTRLERDEHLVVEVTPELILDPNDVLIFVGAPQCASELREIRGLEPSAGDVNKLGIRHSQRRLVEAVIGPDFTGIGQTVKENQFRSHYHAVILSISRSGQMLRGKIGDVKFRVGDTLLLETNVDFVRNYRFRRDFMLVSSISDVAPANFRKAPWAILILLGMVLLNAFGVLEVIQAALLASLAMLVTGCLSVGNVRRHIDLQVIIVIAASFALGAAMVKTGAAATIADTLLIADVGPRGALALVFLLTLCFTELLTNNAAAVLVFPIAMAVADTVGANFMPFAITVMAAASASFIIPIGYQTNLMVMGPGGYRVSDFVRIGVPMSLVTAAVTLTVVPLVWPL